MDICRWNPWGSKHYGFYLNIEKAHTDFLSTAQNRISASKQPTYFQLMRARPRSMVQGLYGPPYELTPHGHWPSALVEEWNLKTCTPSHYLLLHRESHSNVLLNFDVVDLPICLSCFSNAEICDSPLEASIPNMQPTSSSHHPAAPKFHTQSYFSSQQSLFRDRVRHPVQANALRREKQPP